MKPGQVIMPAFDSTGISDNDDIVLGFQPDPPVTVTCTDGFWNGTETDIDCGGGTCEPCEIGQGCNDSSDCASGLCVNGVCQEALVWTGPRIVPWIECAVGDDDNLALIVNGITSWQNITDTAIVSAAASQVNVYNSLKAALPFMNLVPGLKTSSALYSLKLAVDDRGFDSVEGWRIAGASIREMINNTEHSIVLLENETAMKAYVDGDVSLDLDRLREGLRQLPQEATYLWYPSAAGRDELLQRYLDVDMVVDEVLDVQFIDHASLWGPSEVDTSGTINAITHLVAVADRPTVPMILALNRDPWWPDAEVPWAIEYVESKWGSTSWAILYTGQAHWVDGAAAITQYLLEQMVQENQ